MSDIIQNKPVSALLISLLFYGVGLLGQIVFGYYCQIFTAFTYFIFFVIGTILRRCNIMRLRRIPVAVCFFLDALLFVVSQSLSAADNYILGIANVAVTLSLHIVGALMAFTIISWVAKKIDILTKGNYRQWKVYRFLNSYNFPIYLLHQQIIYASITVLNGVLSPAMLMAANLLFSIGISSIIATLLGRWKILRTIMGIN